MRIIEDTLEQDIMEELGIADLLPKDVDLPPQHDDKRERELMNFERMMRQNRGV